MGLNEMLEMIGIKFTAMGFLGSVLILALLLLVSEFISLYQKEKSKQAERKQNNRFIVQIPNRVTLDDVSAYDAAELERIFGKYEKDIEIGQ